MDSISLLLLVSTYTKVDHWSISCLIGIDQQHNAYNDNCCVIQKLKNSSSLHLWVSANFSQNILGVKRRYRAQSLCSGARPQVLRPTTYNMKLIYLFLKQYAVFVISILPHIWFYYNTASLRGIFSNFTSIFSKLDLFLDMLLILIAIFYVWCICQS